MAEAPRLQSVVVELVEDARVLVQRRLFSVRERGVRVPVEAVGVEDRLTLGGCRSGSRDVTGTRLDVQEVRGVLASEVPSRVRGDLVTRRERPLVEELTRLDAGVDVFVANEEPSLRLPDCDRELGKGLVEDRSLLTA